MLNAAANSLSNQQLRPPGRPTTNSLAPEEVRDQALHSHLIRSTDSMDLRSGESTLRRALAGCCLVRLAWLYSQDSHNKLCFRQHPGNVPTMLQLSISKINAKKAQRPHAISRTLSHKGRDGRFLTSNETATAGFVSKTDCFSQCKGTYSRASF